MHKALIHISSLLWRPIRRADESGLHEGAVRAPGFTGPDHESRSQRSERGGGREQRFGGESEHRADGAGLRRGPSGVDSPEAD